MSTTPNLCTHHNLLTPYVVTNRIPFQNLVSLHNTTLCTYRNLLTPYVVTNRIPIQNLVPVKNAAPLYVLQFNNYYVDISEKRPNLNP